MVMSENDREDVFASSRLRGEDHTKFKRPESVLVVVYTRTGKVLLLKRADHPDFWQSITGSMEWGDERPAETAARELREETGIEVPPAALTDWRIRQRYEVLPEFRYRYAPGVTENTEHFFSLELPGEQAIRLSPGEHREYLWLPFDAAIAKVFSWTNRDALVHIMKRRLAPAAGSGA
jgi:dATP pyrophosphohydrolase